jgi:hypothetical protein
MLDIVSQSTPEWPIVYSAEFAGKLEGDAREVQTNFYSIAPMLLQDLQRFANETGIVNSAENWHRFNSCLMLRDKMVVNPGYVNIILADAMNRAAVIFLCKELGSGRSANPDFDGAVSKVVGFRIEADKWMRISIDEFGWKRVELEQMGDDKNLVRFLKGFWNRLTNDDTFEFPKNISHLCSSDLLSKRDLSMVVYRYIYTDVLAQRLFLGLKYVKNTKDVALTGGEDKIESALPELRHGNRIAIEVHAGVPKVVTTKVETTIDTDHLSIGEAFLEHRSTSDDLESFLVMVKSGAIVNLLPYYPSNALKSGHRQKVGE